MLPSLVLQGVIFARLRVFGSILTDTVQVGGLPLAELNNLELQFLLLNDFRLSVPVEELEAYGTMLVEFYARELVAQQQLFDQNQQSSSSVSSPPLGGTSDGMYMRGGPATSRDAPAAGTTS
jgi:PHO85 cyclin-6/7